MPLNILFIGQFKAGKNDGWNCGTTDYAKALKSVGVNLTLRNIYMANTRSPIDSELEELENTKYSHYDICLQRVLPNFFAYDSRFKKNIGMFVLESELKYHNWINRCNLMDCILMPSKKETDSLKNKIKCPVQNIGEALDIESFKKDYTKIDPNVFGNYFIFYTINEMSGRKNLITLIRAYLSEFSQNDNVMLCIKTNRNIEEDINNIKKSLRRFFGGQKYAPIMMIPNNIPNEHIMSIHQHSQCFVISSMGEAFNRGAATALCFGNPVIATDNTGICDYLDESTGWLIKSQKEPCFISDPPINNLYTSNEYFSVPSTYDLMKCMREAYSNKNLYLQKRKNIKDSNLIDIFNYKTAGNRILQACLK